MVEAEVHATGRLGVVVPNLEVGVAGVKCAAVLGSPWGAGRRAVATAARVAGLGRPWDVAAWTSLGVLAVACPTAEGVAARKCMIDCPGKGTRRLLGLWSVLEGGFVLEAEALDLGEVGVVVEAVVGVARLG